MEELKNIKDGVDGGIRVTGMWNEPCDPFPYYGTFGEEQKTEDMKTEYRVEKLLDKGDYRVFETKTTIEAIPDGFDFVDDYYIEEEAVFTGSLSDCESFIRLTEGGYMNG
jgi:hypothetical protein